METIRYTTKEHDLGRAHNTDSGYDIKAYLKENESLEIEPGKYKSIDTGIALELPLNIEAQIRPRSGLALKHGITVLNSPGTIDSGYRGEVKIIIINHGTKEFYIKNGDKIAQIVFCDKIATRVKTVTKIEFNTERGGKGFGSTN